MIRLQKKPIKLRFAISETTEDNPKQVLSDWFTDFAKETTPNGNVTYNIYGTEMSFDKVFTFEANPVTRRIDYNTIIVADHYNSANYADGDYRVAYIFPESKNGIVIGCNSVKDINIPKLYYLGSDWAILAFQIDYDYENLVAYVKANDYIPFDTNTTIWHKFMPTSADQKTNRIKYTGYTKVGLHSSYKDFLELHFEEVDNQ
jgi:hypothetical protein